MKTTAWISIAIAVTVLASQPAAADPEARNHGKPRQKHSVVLAKKHVPDEKRLATERPAPLPGRGDINKKPAPAAPNPQR